MLDTLLAADCDQCCQVSAAQQLHSRLLTCTRTFSSLPHSPLQELTLLSLHVLISLLASVAGGAWFCCHARSVSPACYMLPAGAGCSVSAYVGPLLALSETGLGSWAELAKN